jgi:hypothetical protein
MAGRIEFALSFWFEHGGNFMNKLFLAAGVAAIITAAPAQAASLLSDSGFVSPTTIDFSTPNVAAGTVVTNQFAGVTFSATGSSNFKASGNPGMYSGSLDGFSGGYLDTFTGGGANNTASIFQILFAGPVTRAGAYYEFNTGSPAVTLTALLGNTVVGSFSYNNPSCCGSSQFLGFQGITFDRIQLSGVTGSDFIMDTLRFDATGAVPEPSTWALMLIGFFGLGAAVRRQGRQNLAVSYA